MNGKTSAVAKYLAGVLAVYAIVALCSPDTSRNHPIPDASAQDAGTCGNCTFPQPVRVITADTDSAQLRGGMLEMSESAGRDVVEGPFVLTDAHPSQEHGYARLGVIPSANSCNWEFDDQALVAYVALNTDSVTSTFIHGSRYFVAAGMKLCARGRYSVLWSGFVPFQ